MLAGLLLTSLSVKLLCTPVFPLNSTILLLSALLTLAIFRTRFRARAAFVCCISVSAKVSVPYRHADVTQVLMTLPFNLFEVRHHPLTCSPCVRSSLYSSTYLSLRLSISSHCPPLGYTNLSPESVSSPPARCPALPSGGLCAALLSSLG